MKLAGRLLIAIVVASLIVCGAEADAPRLVAPTDQGLRGNDPTGHGRFGTCRDGCSRRHQGTDWLAESRTGVVAPASGRVTRIGYVYPGNRLFRYVEITTSEGCSVKVMYVSPSVAVGDVVAQGEMIGAAQGIAEHHGRPMRNHVHVQVECKGQFIDPEALIVKDGPDTRLAAQ